jgi:hypothetical protein
MASIQETLGAGRKGYATLIAADPPPRGVFRRIVLPTALATVLLGFAAIVWLAWQDSLSGSGEPPLIRAAAGPIKRPPDTPGGVDIEGERLGVTSLLAGPPPQPRVERLLPREPTPPKSLAEADPGLLAPPAAPPTAAPAGASRIGPTAQPGPAPLSGLGAAAAAAPPTAPAPPATRSAATSAPEPRAAPSPGPQASMSPPAEAPRTAEASRTAEPVRPMPVPPATEPDQAAPSPPAAPSGTLAAARPSPVPAPAPAVAAPAPAPVAALPPAPPSPARPTTPPPERLAAREPASTPLLGSGARGPWGVQIAAVSSREAAERGWAQLQGRHPEVLGGLQLRVDEAKLATGTTLYRLQGLGFPDRESAAQACARLKAAGTECFVVGGR